MPRTTMCSGKILRPRPDAFRVQAMPPDFAAAGLLDDLEGEARAARERLLTRLHDEGVSLEELRAACEEGRLLLLPAELLIQGPPRYTMRDVARRTGLDLEFVRAL